MEDDSDCENDKSLWQTNVACNIFCRNLASKGLFLIYLLKFGNDRETHEKTWIVLIVIYDI